MGFKDVATWISLVFAALALWRNLKADNKNDGAQISEILVKIEIMQSDLKEIKTDVKSEIKAVRADLENLKERLIAVEQSSKSAHKRLDEIHGGEE